ATPSAGVDGTGGSGSGGSGSGSGGTDSTGPSAGPGSGTGGTGAAGGDTTDPTGSGGTGGPGGLGTGTSGGDTGTGANAGQGSGNGQGTGPDGSANGAGPLAGPGTAGNPGAGSAGGDPSTTNGGDAGRGIVTGGPGWGAFASALEALGIDRPPSVTMLPMLVGTSTAMTMAFAFAIFGKKRRDEEPPAPDEVLQANAARGHGSVPGSEIAHGVVRAASFPAPLDLEAGMPRWRRPSLLEARKADPNRSVASSHRMSFESGVVGAADDRERRTIRYAVVRLLDAPDELRSAEIGQLDRGDEVQLIERSGSYWLVLCPDGRQGWLHKMTLGEVVTDAAPTTFGRDVDDDVLTAFLTARARA
ncbi:MAG TPA: SH3 domain-containing protein, partial [Candidatus Limnocylindrales bacterium]|nr:SH3 domain-containing protein [Candidatus Limnocylindrales bacterium]